MTSLGSGRSAAAWSALSSLPEVVRWVIVGAGVTGAAAAAHLARHGMPALVLDAGDAPAAGATGRSGGMVRCYDPDPVVTQLARASLASFADPTEWVGGMAPLHRTGAVTLGGLEHTEAFTAAARTLHAGSWDCEVVHQAEEVLGVGTARGVALVEPAGGWVDPALVTELFLVQAAQLGATISMATSVTGLSTVDAGMLVATNRGTTRATEGVLLAAGGWLAGPPFRELAPDGTVRARAIQTATVARPADVDAHATFVDLRTGAYGKPAGDGASVIGYPLVRWDTGPDTPADPAHRDRTLAAVAEHLPWTRHSPVREVTRSFDAYGDYGDLLVRARLPNVWLCRPGNGGGVRVAPELGREIAQRLSDACRSADALPGRAM